MKKIIPFKRSKPSLRDIIIGILTEWSNISGESSVNMDSFDYGMFKLSKKYPKYFGGLYFDGSKKFPYSRRLEDAMFAFLELGGRKMDEYVISKEAKENVREELSKDYGKRFLEIIEEMVVKFEDYVNRHKIYLNERSAIL